MRAGSGKVDEVGGADNTEDDANGKREFGATRVMDDGGRGELIDSAASFQPAVAGGEYVLDPMSLLTIGKSDHKSVRHSKDVYWRAVEPP